MATTVKGIDGLTLISSWIASTLDEKAITFAEYFGQSIAGNGLTTTQIRNFFGEVVKVRANLALDKFSSDAERSVLMLKPKLAYTAKRHNKIGLNELRDILTPAINAVLSGKDEIDKYKRFINFADFFEAVIAYHRVYENPRQS
jgi:CRISPR-associated protein Csm2